MKNQTIKQVNIVVGKSADGQAFSLLAQLVGIEDQGKFLVTGVAGMDQVDVQVQSIVPDYLADREGYPHAHLLAGLEYLQDVMHVHGGTLVKKHIFMTGYSTEEYGYGPAFGQLTVDASLVIRAIELSEGVRQHKVRTMHVEADSGTFQFDDGDRDFIIEDLEMVVNRNGVTFQANLRVLEEQAYCDTLPVITLIEALACDEDVIFDPVSVDPDCNAYLENVVAKAMTRRVSALDLPDSIDLAPGETAATNIQACLSALTAHQNRAQ